HCMVMRLELGAGVDPRALAEVQRAFTEALRHAGVPFEQAVLARDGRARPFSDICLVVHEEHDRPLRFGGLEITPFAHEAPGEPQPAAWVATMGVAGFLFQLRPDGSGGRMSFCFPRELLGVEAPDVPRRLAAVLGQLAAEPREAPAPFAAPAHTFAPRSPLALRLDGVALSRDELAALAAKAEARLREAGVTEGATVDVDYRHRAELVVAALAILRAGALLAFGRADADFRLSFDPNGADAGAIALALDLPRAPARAARFDRAASPLAPPAVDRAAAALRDASPDGAAHVVWDGALPDNRALAFAVAALQAGGLVSDLPAVASSARVVNELVPLSLAYFPADEHASGADLYRLLVEGTKLADEAGLRAIFAPERHFHPFGGAFPDPLVAVAALAGVTKRIELRAGSVVLPLHDPVRVAESWAMADVLSGGRVGLSIATGWRAEDFVLAPAMFARRKEGLKDLLETLRALW
ncbi:MAG TPA: LLM class flavin-dependent oxidoreductase, partial [Polyangiaceae bacterium]|nr:LLM class flavin-dependent oxidoreductase [Polyangiaceae bacterium]